jgi:hypothetical protein
MNGRIWSSEICGYESPSNTNTMISYLVCQHGRKHDDLGGWRSGLRRAERYDAKRLRSLQRGDRRAKTLELQGVWIGASIGSTVRLRYDGLLVSSQLRGERPSKLARICGGHARRDDLDDSSGLPENRSRLQPILPRPWRVPSEDWIARSIWRVRRIPETNRTPRTEKRTAVLRTPLVTLSGVSCVRYIRMRSEDNTLANNNKSTPSAVRNGRSGAWRLA